MTLSSQPPCLLTAATAPTTPCSFHNTLQLPQHPAAPTAQATTHADADATRMGTMQVGTTQAGRDGEARVGGMGNRDGNPGGAGQDGRRKASIDHATGKGGTAETGGCGDAVKDGGNMESTGDRGR